MLQKVQDPRDIILRPHRLSASVARLLHCFCSAGQSRVIIIVKEHTGARLFVHGQAGKGDPFAQIGTTTPSYGFTLSLTLLCNIRFQQSREGKQTDRDSSLYWATQLKTTRPLAKSQKARLLPIDAHFLEYKMKSYTAYVVQKLSNSQLFWIQPLFSDVSTKATPTNRSVARGRSVNILCSDWLP